MAFDDIPPPSEVNSPLITDILRRQNNILEHIAYSVSEFVPSLKDLRHGFTCTLCKLAKERQ